MEFPIAERELSATAHPVSSQRWPEPETHRATTPGAHLELSTALAARCFESDRTAGKWQRPPKGVLRTVASIPERRGRPPRSVASPSRVKAVRWPVPG